MSSIVIFKIYNNKKWQFWKCLTARLRHGIFSKTVTAGVPYAHLGTGELQRLQAAGGGHLCFLFHSLYFPHFLSKHQWRPPQEERRQERAVWRAGPGSTASPSSGDPKAPTATL